MNNLELMRAYFDWNYENPDKANPTSAGLYFFILDHSNRLGFKEVFGLPTVMAMEATGIRNYKTYKKAFDLLVNNGFIKLVEVSKNQYSANQIALVKNTKAHTKALTKASTKHTAKQVQSTDQSTDQGTDQSTAHIDILNTKYQIPNKEKREKIPPDFDEALKYLIEEKKVNEAPAKSITTNFFNFYESKGWKVGKSKMVRWKPALTNALKWEQNEKLLKNTNNLFVMRQTPIQQ